MCEQCRYAGGLNTSEDMHGEEFQEDKSDGILEDKYRGETDTRRRIEQ